MLFLFLDSLYHSALLLKDYGAITASFYTKLANPVFPVLIKLGIFISMIFIVHFIMGKNIEYFKNIESSLSKLQTLKHELEKRAHELEGSKQVLETKVHELEKYNEIERERETKMMHLIKKIELLEGKIKKKQ